MHSILKPLLRILPPRESQLIEVLEEAAEEASRQWQVSPRGSRIFPFRTLRLCIWPSNASEENLLRDGTYARLTVANNILRRLAQADCELPGDLFVTVERKEGPSPDGKRYRIEYREEGSHPPSNATQPALLRLRVIGGKADPMELILGPHPTLIGRNRETLLARGTRSNDLAFDAADPIGQSVSRDHARIQWDALRNCHLLFHDSPRNQTDVLRPGKPAQSAGRMQGIQLQPGDRIRLGRSLLLVEAAPSEPSQTQNP